MTLGARAAGRAVGLAGAAAHLASCGWQAARRAAGPVELKAPDRSSGVAVFEKHGSIPCNVRNDAGDARRGLAGGLADGAARLASRGWQAVRSAAVPVELTAPDRPSRVAVLKNAVPIPCNVRADVGDARLRACRETDMAGANVRRRIAGQRCRRVAAGPVELKAPDRLLRVAVLKNAVPIPCNVRNDVGDARLGRAGRLTGGGERPASYGRAAVRVAAGPVELNAPDRSSRVAVLKNAVPIPCNVRNGVGDVRRGRAGELTGGAEHPASHGRAAVRVAAGPGEPQATDYSSRVAVLKNAVPIPCNVRNGVGDARRGLASGTELKARGSVPPQVAFMKNAVPIPCNVRNGARTACRGAFWWARLATRHVWHRVAGKLARWAAGPSAPDCPSKVALLKNTAPIPCNVSRRSRGDVRRPRPPVAGDRARSVVDGRPKGWPGGCP